ncbi:phosphoethanolamine/phosphocholine phosphatase isoform X1 [Passer montanus]|uniref:phosphoethanolamine/phosphocholine phosphatase isoform X1 n=1 Tax=Passer montanus TaxID=9160 RepID=UPI00196185BE|nr:phosphoethanolamine/phosphocholine phosphatase isoform X1 [Passer montanus]
MTSAHCGGSARPRWRRFKGAALAAAPAAAPAPERPRTGPGAAPERPRSGPEPRLPPRAPAPGRTGRSRQVPTRPCPGWCQHEEVLPGRGAALPVQGRGHGGRAAAALPAGVRLRRDHRGREQRRLGGAGPRAAGAAAAEPARRLLQRAHAARAGLPGRAGRAPRRAPRRLREHPAVPRHGRALPAALPAPGALRAGAHLRRQHLRRRGQAARGRRARALPQGLQQPGRLRPARRAHAGALPQPQVPALPAQHVQEEDPGRVPGGAGARRRGVPARLLRGRRRQRLLPRRDPDGGGRGVPQEGLPHAQADPGEPGEAARGLPGRRGALGVGGGGGAVPAGAAPQEMLRPRRLRARPRCRDLLLPFPGQGSTFCRPRPCLATEPRPALRPLGPDRDFWWSCRFLSLLASKENSRKSSSRLPAGWARPRSCHPPPGLPGPGLLIPLGIPAGTSLLPGLLIPLGIPAGTSLLPQLLIPWEFRLGHPCSLGS